MNWEGHQERENHFTADKGVKTFADYAKLFTKAPLQQHHNNSQTTVWEYCYLICKFDIIERRKEVLIMEILEVDGKVIIGGFEFYGQIQHNNFCSQCKSNLIYYDKFDTYFCPKCNSWTESKCSDPHYEYCPNRPKYPLPSK